MSSEATSVLFLLACVVFGLASQEMDYFKYEAVTDDSYGPTPHEMLMDAAVGTTLKPCLYKVRCGFFILDDDTTGYHNHSFIPYCQCPEGQDCLLAGKSKNNTYLFYKCRSPESSTESLPALRESSTESIEVSSTERMPVSTESSTESLEESSTERVFISTESSTESFTESAKSSPENLGEFSGSLLTSTEFSMENSEESLTKILPVSTGSSEESATEILPGSTVSSMEGLPESVKTSTVSIAESTESSTETKADSTTSEVYTGHSDGASEHDSLTTMGKRYGFGMYNEL